MIKKELPADSEWCIVSVHNELNIKTCKTFLIKF